MHLLFLAAGSVLVKNIKCCTGCQHKGLTVEPEEQNRSAAQSAGGEPLSTRIQAKSLKSG